MVDRVHRGLTDGEIHRNARTYHAWRGEKEAGEYRDVAGFCKSATWRSASTATCSHPAATSAPRRRKTTSHSSRRLCCDLVYGFDWSPWRTGTPADRIALIPAAQEHVLALPDGKERFLQAVAELSRAFALSVPREEALRIGDDVACFQAVRAAPVKRAPGDVRPAENLDHAIRQLVSRALVPQGVVDLFEAAGLRKPDVSILSEEFLAEVRGMPHKNLSVEVLRKLLQGEIRARMQRNVVRARSFAEMLEQAVRRYQNRAIDAVQVIEELIELARQIREADRRGEAMGLSEEELAFYEAVATSQGPQAVLARDALRTIAQELLRVLRSNVTVDWNVREHARANLRVLVKRVLHKYGYPPDRQEQAAETVRTG